MGTSVKVTALNVVPLSRETHMYWSAATYTVPSGATRTTGSKPSLPSVFASPKTVASATFAGTAAGDSDAGVTQPPSTRARATANGGVRMGRRALAWEDKPCWRRDALI